MKMQIKEFAELFGVSVRTLHYYDRTGLLKPAFTDPGNSYRYYDDTCAQKMFEIMFLRELDFSLKDIGDILSSPDYNKKEAFRKQKELLICKKQHLENLIDSLEKAEKGEIDMASFKNNDYENKRKEYEKEVREKWGDTEAYKQSQEKTAGYTEDKWQSATDGLDSIMGEFAEAMKKGVTCESNEALSLAEKLQKYITDNFYDCTKDILRGLGEMYVSDERFRSNIDKHGEGTAEFIRNVIGNYCGN